MRTAPYGLLLLALTAAALRPAHAEDMQLRARASALLDAARLASQIKGGPYVMETEATFLATADDGTLKSGTYHRLRLPTGALRQELRFGDWQATQLGNGQQVSTVGPWEYPPYAVRHLRQLVPFFVAAFERTDVVRAIRDGSANGQQATCVDYDTVHGEQRSSNELCLSKADGTLLSIREENRTYEYSKYATTAGALYPRHIEYREANSFSLAVDLTLTKLDRAPEDALTPPTGGSTTTFCKSFTQPVPLHVPQPEGKGGPDAAVIDVPIRLYIEKNGTVSNPQLVHPARPDLDKEALALVQTWTFQPATCNGALNNVPTDVILHFQGR